MDTFPALKNCHFLKLFFRLFLPGSVLGLLDLLEDRLGGGGGVCGARDRAANDQHGGSVGDRLSRGGDALLVFDGASGGADSGDNQKSVWADLFAEESDLFGRANHAVDA